MFLGRDSQVQSIPPPERTNLCRRCFLPSARESRTGKAAAARPRGRRTWLCSPTGVPIYIRVTMATKLSPQLNVVIDDLHALFATNKAVETTKTPPSPQIFTLKSSSGRTHVVVIMIHMPSCGIIEHREHTSVYPLYIQGLWYSHHLTNKYVGHQFLEAIHSKITLRRQLTRSKSYCSSGNGRISKGGQRQKRICSGTLNPDMRQSTTWQHGILARRIIFNDPRYLQ